MVSVEEAQSHLTEKECYGNQLIYILKYKDYKSSMKAFLHLFSEAILGDVNRRLIRLLENNEIMPGGKKYYTIRNHW